MNPKQRKITVQYRKDMLAASIARFDALCVLSSQGGISPALLEEARIAMLTAQYELDIIEAE